MKSSLKANNAFAAVQSLSGVQTVGSRVGEVPQRVFLRVVGNDGRYPLRPHSRFCLQPVDIEPDLWGQPDGSDDHHGHGRHGACRLILFSLPACKAGIENPGDNALA